MATIETRLRGSVRLAHSIAKLALALLHSAPPVQIQTHRSSRQRQPASLVSSVGSRAIIRRQLNVSVKKVTFSKLTSWLASHAMIQPVRTAVRQAAFVKSAKETLRLIH